MPAIKETRVFVKYETSSQESLDQFDLKFDFIIHLLFLQASFPKIISSG